MLWKVNTDVCKQTTKFETLSLNLTPTTAIDVRGGPYIRRDAHILHKASDPSAVGLQRERRDPNLSTVVSIEKLVG